MLEPVIEVILWDVMDTLVWDPFFTIVPAFFDLSPEQLLSEKDPQAWNDFEAGRIDETVLFERYFRDRRPVDGPALKARMVDSYRWLEGMEALLADLRRRGVAMHALSNYPPWILELDGRLGLSRYLSLRFVSCRTGQRKPDAAAFLGPLQALGTQPDKCLFIDDRQTNCDAARALGLHTLRFDGRSEATRAALEALQLT